MPPCSGSTPSTGHGAAVALPVALEDLDRGRLAGAVRPEEAEDLALLDGEADPRNRLVGAVALAELVHLESAHAVSSSSTIPATGKPGSRPTERERDLGAVGLMTDGCDRPDLTGQRLGERLGGRARRESLDDAHGCPGQAPDLGGRLLRAEQWAREDDRRRVAPSGEGFAERSGLFDAGRGQLAKIVRVARGGLSMSAEVDAHLDENMRNERVAHL